jgi:hypothetical protein
MIPPKIRAVVLGLILAGCGNSEPKPPKMSEVFPNLPLPPQAEFVSRSGGKDALQVTVRSPFKAEQVLAYYREILKTGGWQLVNEARDAEGAVVLFAKQKGPPLWVRIRSTDDSTGALVELSGALTVARDSAKTGKKS